MVVDEEHSLHISYPRAKLVPTLLFTAKQREPLVVRPSNDSDKVAHFLENLKLQSIGKKYDYYRIV